MMSCRPHCSYSSLLCPHHTPLEGQHALLQRHHCRRVGTHQPKRLLCLCPRRSAAGGEGAGREAVGARCSAAKASHRSRCFHVYRCIWLVLVESAPFIWTGKPCCQCLCQSTTTSRTLYFFAHLRATTSRPLIDGRRSGWRGESPSSASSFLQAQRCEGGTAGPLIGRYRGRHSRVLEGLRHTDSWHRRRS